MSHAFGKFFETARQLKNATDGSVAMMFGILSIPLVLAAGGMVDYSRFYYAHTNMQDAVDAAALRVSTIASGKSQSQLNKSSKDFFDANFHDVEVADVALTPTYSSMGPTFTLAGAGTLKTYFLGLIGIHKLPVQASSTVAWSNTRLRLALVLDNTGSMNSAGKIAALKTATSGLLTQIEGAATTNGVAYVSIIPFVKDVNVGSANYAASWIDWTDWDEKNGTCSKSGKTTKTSCTTPTGNGKGTNAAGTWTVADHKSWTGCVTDRGKTTGPDSGNYDTNVSPPVSGKAATLFPAEQYSACPQAIMPLTYDWSALNSQVNKMVANGNTNQAIGLVHGWQSLVGGGPYPASPAMDSGYTYKQAIVLMTDGLNTEDRWYSSQGSIDARQQLTCNAVKAAGIIVYTVQVNTGNDPVSTLLQNCASDPSKFFYMTDANALVGTFEQIGKELSDLRLAS